MIGGKRASRKAHGGRKTHCGDRKTRRMSRRRSVRGGSNYGNTLN